MGPKVLKIVFKIDVFIADIWTSFKMRVPMLGSLILLTIMGQLVTEGGPANETTSTSTELTTTTGPQPTEAPPRFCKLNQISLASFINC